MRKLKALVKGTAIAVFSGIVQMVIAIGLITVWPYRLATGVEIDAWLVISVPLGFLVGLIVGASIAIAHLSKHTATQPADDARKSARRGWMIVYSCVSVVFAVIAVVTLSRSSSHRDAIRWAQLLYFDAVIAASVAFYAGCWRFLSFIKSRGSVGRALPQATRSPRVRIAAVLLLLIAGSLWFLLTKPIFPRQLLIQYRFGRRSFGHVALYDTNLSGVDLSGANLTGSSFNDSTQIGINLSGAELSRAYFDRADLTNANLSDAILRQAWLDRTNLNGADLRGTNLEGAHLSRTTLRGTVVDDRTVWPKPRWKLCWEIVNFGADNRNLEAADLFWTGLQGANLRDADLTRADLAGADMQGADLSGANLDSAKLINADLTGADLTGTILTNVILGSTSFEEAIYDEDTIWPASVDPAEVGAIRVE